MSARDCRFEATSEVADDGRLVVVSQCGLRRLSRSPDGHYGRPCDFSGPNCNGWGVRVKRWLARVGITHERYVAARGRHRVIGGMHCVLVPLPPDEPSMCGCASREEYLNKLDLWSRSVVNRWWPVHPRSPSAVEPRS